MYQGVLAVVIPSCIVCFGLKSPMELSTRHMCGL